MQPSPQSSGNFGPATVVASTSHSNHGFGLPGDGYLVVVFPACSTAIVLAGLHHNHLARSWPTRIVRAFPDDRLADLALIKGSLLGILRNHAGMLIEPPSNFCTKYGAEHRS